MNKRAWPFIFLSIYLSLALSGCDRFGSYAPAPTPWSTEDLPTIVALTAAALPSLTPSVTASPSETPPPTETATPTETTIPATLPPLDPTYFVELTRNAPTFTPTPEIGRVAIQLDAPGEMSKLVSPIELRGYITPRLAGNTIIELIGEDGRVITRMTKKTESIYNQYARLSVNIEYEIRSGGELARLQVRTENKNGVVTGINSVHILLLSLGAKELNPSIGATEVCLFTKPLPKATITGGEVLLEGTMRPYNDSPVIFELTDERGKRLSSRMIALAPADGSYQKFTATIPYNVKQSTPGFLVVSQMDDRIPGPRYLYTQPITLAP